MRARAMGPVRTGAAVLGLWALGVCLDGVFAARDAWRRVTR